MKQLLIIISFLFCIGASAQIDSTGLRTAIGKLDKAMVARDTAALNSLLDKKVSYGHSNGWVQTKKDIREDFLSGKVNYQKMESTDVQILSIDKDLATVRMLAKAEGLNNGKNFSVSLFVMQVWKKDKKGWQLLARQGAKQ